MTRRELLSKLGLTAGGGLMLFLGACKKKAPWEEPAGDTEMSGGEPDRGAAAGEAGGVDSGGAEGGSSYVPPDVRPAGSNSAVFGGAGHSPARGGGRSAPGGPTRRRPCPTTPRDGATDSH